MNWFKRTWIRLADMKRSRLIIGMSILAFSAVFMIVSIVLIFNGQNTPKEHTIAVNGEGYSIARVVKIGEKADGNIVKREEHYHFKVIQHDNYSGTPVVKVNDKAVTADANNVYSIWYVKSNKTISVTGLRRIENKLETPFPSYTTSIDTDNNKVIILFTWASVPHATSYIVNINGTSYSANGCEYTLSVPFAEVEAGCRIIKIKANAVRYQYLESEWTAEHHILSELFCTCGLEQV